MDLIAGVRTLLEIFSRERQFNRQQADVALLAIIAAANETRIYLESLEKTGRRKRPAERELSAMWSKAAVHVRVFDRDVADRCLSKSDYWTSPDKWSESMVVERKIGLDEIRLDARRLLLEH